MKLKAVEESNKGVSTNQQNESKNKNKQNNIFADYVSEMVLSCYGCFPLFQQSPLLQWCAERPSPQLHPEIRENLDVYFLHPRAFQSVLCFRVALKLTRGHRSRRNRRFVVH